MDVWPCMDVRAGRPACLQTHRLNLFCTAPLPPLTCLCKQELLNDFTCALKRKMLLHGRIYIFSAHIAFHTNLFGYVKTKVTQAAAVLPCGWCCHARDVGRCLECPPPSDRHKPRRPPARLLAPAAAAACPPSGTPPS